MRQLPPWWSPDPWPLDQPDRGSDDLVDYVLWTVVIICGVICGVILARMG